MDIITKQVIADSRTDQLHIYWLHDLHKGAPNFDEARLKAVVRLIKADPCFKLVFLGGDLCDLVILRDMKRFTPDNLDDETLTGTPKQIRKKLSNIALNQAKGVVKILAPIREFIVASVHGNHELSVLKSSGIDIHNIICEDLGIRNSGSVGMAAITIRRLNESRLLKIAFMHNAAGGRTAGASNNSLARALNIFAADIVFQGHNHSPAFQRIVSVDITSPKNKKAPIVVKRDRVGINNGSFVASYMQNTNSYDQDHLYNPKSEVFYRASVKLVVDGSTEEHKQRETSRLSIVVEELHV